MTEPKKQSGCWYGFVGLLSGGCLLPLVLLCIAAAFGDIGGPLFLADHQHSACANWSRTWIMVSLRVSEKGMTTPNESLQPTQVALVSFAFAGCVTGPAWLSFCR